MSPNKGYIDNQLPPVIIGGIIMVGLIHYVINPKIISEISLVKLGLTLMIPGACFIVGFYVNWGALKFPESPFNKHVSPFLLGGLVVSSLAYGIWRFYSTPLRIFIYFFIAAAVIASGLSIYLENIRLKHYSSEKKEQGE